MEPAGLAVGTVALVSLFSTCLEVVEKFDNYKNFRSDSHRLTAQFEADKLRFEKWGRDVGIEQNKQSEGRHEAFGDRKTYLTVENILAAIQNILSDAEDTSLPPRLGADMSSIGQKPLSRNKAQSHQSRFKWVLIDRPRRIAQVNEFGKLVQTLCDLVPPSRGKDIRVGQEGPIVGNGAQYRYNHEANNLIKLFLDYSVDTGSLIAEFQRVLVKIERDIEGCSSYPSPKKL